MKLRFASIGTVVKFRDDFGGTRAVQGKLFRIVSEPQDTPDGLEYVTVERIGLKKPWSRLAWLEDLQVVEQ
jgi:hypothetical protein